jgi:hypothetical protein
MDDRCRGDQAVDVATRSERSDAPPFQGDPVGDRQDSIGMILPQLLEPFREASRGLRVGFASEGDATHDLTKRERAQIDALRANRSQPSQSLATAAAGLGNDIRIDEVHLNRRVAAWRFGARADGLGELVVPSGT